MKNYTGRGYDDDSYYSTVCTILSIMISKNKEEKPSLSHRHKIPIEKDVVNEYNLQDILQPV